MKPLLSALAALFLSLIPVSAYADTYQFSFTAGPGSTADPFTFQLPASPAPLGTITGFVTSILAPHVVAAGVNGPYVIDFYIPNGCTPGGLANCGGLDIGGSVYDGPQLFAGNTLTPTFVIGSYTLSETTFSGTQKNQLGTLTISDLTPGAPTPEPSSLILLGTGALAIAATARRRLRAVTRTA